MHHGDPERQTHVHTGAVRKAHSVQCRWSAAAMSKTSDFPLLQVCVEGRLYLEFMFDDMMRIKTWHFSIRQHREVLPRSILAMHVSVALRSTSRMHTFLQSSPVGHLVPAGSADARPAGQEYHQMWAVQLYTQLPPCKRVQISAGV